MALAASEQMHIEDRHDAYRALRSVLHVLRDRLTPEQAVHLGAQLPVLVRRIYYDDWRIAGKPSDERQPAEFATLVAADLPRRWPATRYGCRGLFSVCSGRNSIGAT